jgi:anti-anti-sigma factor
MKVDRELHGDDIVLVPRERIDSAVALAFEEIAELAVADATTRVIFDFSALDYISSAGLRVVLKTAKQCRTARLGFVLCGLAPPIAKTFEITGLSNLLTIVRDRTAAFDTR